MPKFFSSLVAQSTERSAEATLGVLSITDPGLRRHLSQLMQGDCGTSGAFLAPPLFEPTFGWQQHSETMAALAGPDKMLSEAVVASLDRKENGRYRFASSWRPFTHQFDSWSSLLQKKRSVVVTSGTGSGKTECFMVPVLDDLCREYMAGDQKPLVGVRALFLYPLNALINSQKERLNAWTKVFDGGIRYCLYNGNTPELKTRVRAEQRKAPNEVLSRELLREAPPPILVTNGTMLEYMMIRQIDAPIIQRSREEMSLRWIILDEAHTYVGSQAAELALQLRRVMTAFGVDPENVRFIATSATLAGEGAAEQLRRFLADLSGVPVARIDVWAGSREIPELPEQTEASTKEVGLQELERIKETDVTNPEINPERFYKLCRSREARIIRNAVITAARPLTLVELRDKLQAVGYDLSQQDILRWLDICSGTKRAHAEPAFLKLRAHLFQRTTSGLWACFDEHCSAKRRSALGADWPFGYVYTTQRQRCDCGSLVFELVFCRECNEPHLLAQDRAGALVQWMDSGGDEFSLQTEISGEEENESEQLPTASAAAVPLVLSPPANKSDEYVVQIFDKHSGRFDALGNDPVSLRIAAGSPICSRTDCAYKGYADGMPFRRALLGGPFYVSAAVRTVLEYCADFPSGDSKQQYGPHSLPARGRRLITFTDSRQGTARMSVRMQQDAERSTLRRLVVDILAQHQRSHDEQTALPALPESELDAIISAKREETERFSRLGLPREAERAEKDLRRYEALRGSKDDDTSNQEPAEIEWNDIVTELAEKTDIKGAMLEANKLQNPETFGSSDGPRRLADMLLFREFMRRPKRQNSLETQGLVRVLYRGVDESCRPPSRWCESGLMVADWRDFLKVALDFYVRENSFIQVDAVWRNWIGTRFAPKQLRNPKSMERDDARSKRWPQIRNGRHTQRLIKLLLLGAGMHPDNPVHMDLVNEWLRAAWLALTKASGPLSSDGNQHYLRREHMRLSLMDHAFVCPVTNRLMDTTFTELTPYLPTDLAFDKTAAKLRERFSSEWVELPAIWQFDASQEDYARGLETIRTKIAANELVQGLRNKGLWTDINDRAVEPGFYYRVAEHSAQQSSKKLKEYEGMFKDGRLNILNCSTTMEMGVDIGGISAVVMNNVPPHPANYLQRAGRAGRSHESRALAYTLCKSNPHDQQVFESPVWVFETQIAPPAVALSSVRLVQRHVNAMLLSDFLVTVIGATEKERTSLDSYWFYGDEFGDAPCTRFIERLGHAVCDVDSRLAALVRGTALAGAEPQRLRQVARMAIKRLQEHWLDTYHYLRAEEQGAKANSAYARRLDIELARHCKEYLLRELSARAFLPGYGFPTDVVTFDNFTIADYKRAKQNQDSRPGRDDNLSQYKTLPSRNLAVAIREYAPGAEVVLDGRVYRSAGVSMHWHQFGGRGKEEQRLGLAWRCRKCGTQGYEEAFDRTSNLVCSNDRCQSPIESRDTRRVLRPAGFVTDAYANISNNIEHQRFIPVEDAWVFVEAPRVPLPNPVLGYMASGADGHVFHHSRGEFRTGYALCLSCGRAESMLATGEFPGGLSPGGEHYPPRPTKDDKDQDNKRLFCPGSATLEDGISLGVTAVTDVFELILRSPKRGEYLPETESGRSIATTIAVAARAALAEILGISRSEIGYATRSLRQDDGQAVCVIQLFDVASGGAGFASSAPLHIEELLKNMVAALQCPHCETACNECLLDSETRHDHELLDRTRALEWVGVDFGQYVGLPEEDRLALPDARYAPGTISDVLGRLINRGATKVVFVLDGDPSDWDLLAPRFRRTIETYALIDELEVVLVVPQGINDEEIWHDLRSLSVEGVVVATPVAEVPECLVAQVSVGSATITLACRDRQAAVPHDGWHTSKDLVVESRSVNFLDLEPLNVDMPEVRGTDGDIIEDLHVLDELNGSVDDFGARFWRHLSDACVDLASLLDNRKIKRLTYTDRYLQNPTSIVILGSVLRALKARMAEPAQVKVVTLFKDKSRRGSKAFHDWDNRADFSCFAERWLSAMSGQNVELGIKPSNRDIPHHRRLDLEFEGGKELSVRLDQGVGYWQVRFGSPRDIWFEFDSGVDEQLDAMARLLGSAVVRNSGQKWATDILVTLTS